MKNITITIFIVLLFVILALVFTMFQVRETESALVMTFGKATRQITEPGLYFKWPPPIEMVQKFDSRSRGLVAEIGETPTKGAVPIIVNTFVVWRVAEPLAFFNAVGTVSEAENKLLTQISDTQNKVIGRHDFSEFVNSDPAKIKLDEIEKEMLAEIQKAVRSDYGIEIKAIGIRQLKISEDVSKDVFERMKAERNRRTEATIAEGNAASKKIVTDALSMQTELLAAAEARAKAIRAQGDAEAAQYYKLLEQDPQLAMFLRDIDALKKILEQRATVVISADTEPFKLLRQMPDLKPKE
ncbi:MAG: SPFH domain-containing protein [Sedimentisphaerales bacterium]|jgi:membrane protease subunit HflC